MKSGLRFIQGEFIGAFGDCGILIPILISLVAINGLNGQIVLLTVGLFYIACGFYYKVPISVQPLKVMAAIVIAGRLQPSILSAGGILIGIILLFLAATVFINQLNRIFSSPIVRGIQLGV